MKTKIMISSTVTLTVLFLGLAGIVYAAGSIDATNKWAWGGNAGWINFNPDHGGVTVYDDHLEGYAWAENIGWIKLGTCTGPHANSSYTNYGVNNDGNGNLSGYAWSSNAGWINFNPSDSQVTIDPATGEFDGYAWAENVGWIHFSNSGANDYGVLTSWRGSSGGGDNDIFLPIIFKSFAIGPDLVIDKLTTSSGSVSITIRNAGNKATDNPFWVDVYFNPNAGPPGVNQPWDTIASHGSFWGVTATLNPGQSLTLITGGKHYAGGSSSFPSGATVYGYADSVNFATTTGNVPESNEANNQFGPVISSDGKAGAIGPFDGSTLMVGLPER